MMAIAISVVLRNYDDRNRVDLSLENIKGNLPLEVFQESGPYGKLQLHLPPQYRAPTKGLHYPHS